ncbi:MAG: hypothetical protein IID39_06765 [Planctomycetes bacterium]|nr:hypothetical protein [Planctomycetota bacterium]
MKHRMNSIAAVLVSPLILAVGCSVSASFSFLAGRVEEPFSVSAPFEGAGSLTILWRNGEVSVRVDESATEITANGTKIVQASTDDVAQEMADQIEITMEVAESFPTQVFLRFTAPDDLIALFSADVEVVLPAGIVLSISNDNGNVTVQGNTESTEIDVNIGIVTVTDQSGDITVDITVGRIDIDSTAATVEATGDTASISITAQPGADGSVVARTANGSVSISVPANTQANLSLKTTVGAVVVSLEDFTVNDLPPIGGFVTEVTATLNGGGSQIVGETVIGNVSFGSL